MEGEISPADVKSNPKLIKETQEDIGKLDILVCGVCHSVFHFVEEFQKHKEPTNCSGVSNIKDSTESKPQVWAFLLWKNAQRQKENNESDTDSTWKIYQSWCKVDVAVREAWITAAKSLQLFCKVSAAKMQVIRPGQKLVAKVKTPGAEIRSLNSEAIKKEDKDDDLEEGEIRLTEEQRKRLKIIEDEDDALGSDENSESDLDTEDELLMAAMKKNSLKQQAEENAIKKLAPKIVTPVSKPTLLNNSGGLNTISKLQKVQTPVVQSRKALRTYKEENATKDCNIEKILAKRYNPRKKTFEYLIKWEGFTHEENTWEPVAHLEQCRPLVDNFERNLARQKELKAQQAAAQAQANKAMSKATKLVSTPSPSTLTTTGRPQRTSKQKALNQVKAWCGDIVDNDENGLKRRSDSDSDEDGVVEKKMRLISDDDEIGSTPQKQGMSVHRIVKQTVGGNKIINGVNKTGNTTVASPVIVSGRPGMTTTTIRMDQKQVSGISKNVYIMNEQTGVVKLDSRGVVQTGGSQPRILKQGNTIYKVAQKVGGQAQLRIVQKEEGEASPPMRLSPGMSSQAVTKQIIRRTVTTPGRSPIKGTPTPKIITTAAGAKQLGGVTRTVVGSPSTRIVTKPGARMVPKGVTKLPVVTAQPPEDDSDDGLGNEEDLFPKDLPLPVPDSPPRDFTLCPLTGKVLGPGQAPIAAELASDSLEALVKTVTEGGDSQSQEQETSNSMPSLLTTESSSVVTTAATIVTTTGVDTVTAAAATTSATVVEGATDGAGNMMAVTLENGTPLMITGDDGIVYQVAGQDEQGQTLLVAQGADGQQQCMLVTTEGSEGAEGVLTLNTAVAEAVSQMETSEAGASTATAETSPAEQQLTISTDAAGEAGADGEGSDDGQVVAEVVKAEPPSPGGTRQVILLMPDGNLVTTTVDAEQYASLGLEDK